MGKNDETSVKMRPSTSLKDSELKFADVFVPFKIFG